MTPSTDAGFPKLRPIDAHPIRQGRRAGILLRDPLQLSDKTVIVPQQLAPLLALCDGTRDNEGLRAALAVRFGVRVRADLVAQVLAALDEALLLEGDRFAQARDQALAEFREAPFRRPVGAGVSYPSQASGLGQLLDGYLDAAQEVKLDSAEGRGLVTPHIDYQRGGVVYARVWKRAAEMIKAAQLVVVLGTDHLGPDAQITLTRQSYATPFGVLPTAQDVVDALEQEMGAERAFAEELHHRSEHSIELAAVWLQHIRGGQPCELVPILCGSFDKFLPSSTEPERDPEISSLVRVLRETVSTRRAIVVAAGDLSHVGPAFGGRPVDFVARAHVRAFDDQLIQRVCEGDPQGFLAVNLREGSGNNVCGVSVIYLALQTLSPVRGEQVAYDLCPADERGTSLVSICGIVLK